MADIVFELFDASDEKFDKVRVSGLSVTAFADAAREPRLPRQNGFATVDHQAVVETAIALWMAQGRPRHAKVRFGADGLQVVAQPEGGL